MGAMAMPSLVSASTKEANPVGVGGRDPRSAEKLLEVDLAPSRFGGEQNPSPGIGYEASQARCGVLGAVIRGQFRQGVSGEVHAVPTASRARVDSCPSIAFDAGVEIPGPHV